MLAAGINVTLATDSLASNPDLSVLKEAQLLHQRDQLDPLSALEMITRRPAQALGLGDQLGTLTPNKFADMIVLPISLPADRNPTTLLPSILSLAPQPSAVYIAGSLVPL
jgi:cytosine/adenosine deaminase-related metal-dependent hydrolase